MRARQLEVAAIDVSALTYFLGDTTDPEADEFGLRGSTVSQAVYTGGFLRDARFGRVVRRLVVCHISRSERRAELTDAESHNASTISGSRTVTFLKKIPEIGYAGDGNTASSLQLRHHRGWVPVAPHGLNFSFLVDLEYIDAFEGDLPAVLAGAVACELHCDPVPGLEDMVLCHGDRFKGSEHPR